MSIHKKTIEVMRSISAVTKTQKNQAQGYSFRGIDDVYNEIHQHLAEHGVFTVPEVLSDRTEERKTPKGTVLIYRVLTIKFYFYADDGSFITATVIGEGMDSGDKASNKAMSVAHKYALVQVFCIPTKEPKDPEIDSHEIAKEELYTGTLEQKHKLRSIAKSYNIADPNDLRTLSNALMGTSVASMETNVSTFVATPHA